MDVVALRNRGISLDVIEKSRTSTRDTLAKCEKKLETIHARLTRAIREGERFRYTLSEFTTTAADVAMLRDRLFELDNLIEAIDRKTGSTR